MRFHITANGEVAPCSATVRACPLQSAHFDSAEEANALVMRTMSEAQGVSAVNNSMEREAKKGDTVAMPLSTASGERHVLGKVLGVTRSADGERVARVSLGPWAPVTLVPVSELVVRVPDAGVLKYVDSDGDVFVSAGDIDTSGFDELDLELFEWASRGMDDPAQWDPVDDLGVTRQERAAEWRELRRKCGFSVTG